MENYKEEINKLQTQLDELKSKIENSEFEFGYWVEIISGGNGALDSNTLIGEIVKYDDVKNNTTGGVEHFNYLPCIRCINGQNWQLCDGFKLRNLNKWEVDEALTKEAIKRGFKEGVNFKSIIYGSERVFTHEKLILNKDGVLTNNGNVIFSNGKWATPIKTIDDLASQLIGLDLEDLTIELIKNKTEIIEILKNL